MSTRRIPELKKADTSDILRWAAELSRILSSIDDQANRPVSTGWSMTNVTEDRILDADATTLAEVADVLATLINDLKSKKIIG